MVKIDKLAKYVRHPSKAQKLAKQIKKLQTIQTKSKQVGIDSYQKYLKKNKSRDTKYRIINKSTTKKKISKSTPKKKSSTSTRTRTPKKSKKLTKSNSKNSKTSKNSKYSKYNISKLVSRKSKIIQPDVLNIPNMEKNMEIQPIAIPTTLSIAPMAPDLGDDYIIAIPSYMRSDIIKTHTLAVLNRHNIKPEYITIFVANQAEHDIYTKAVPKLLYNNIIVGVLGLKNQRNFISEYYPEGKYVVEMDDDIKNIMQLVVKKDTGKMAMSAKKVKKTVKPISDLDAFIRRAFEMCIESNIFLWGVYPLVNPHFMTYKITTDLRFIVGPMWGMINRHRTDLKLTVDEKENSERTLQFWVADGAVLRFNNVGIETKYYKNQGGMQSEGKDRKVEALKSVYYLNKMYPTLTKVSLTKKNGMPEIKMNRKGGK